MFANTKDEFALVLFGTEGVQHNNHRTFIVSHPLRVEFLTRVLLLLHNFIIYFISLLFSYSLPFNRLTTPTPCEVFISGYVEVPLNLKKHARETLSRNKPNHF